MWYHISVQGNGQFNIFQNNNEVLHAIDLLAVYSHKYEVDVLAYQFLSNHYHLILKCQSPAAFMHAYRISFTRYVNYKNCSIGSIGRIHYSRGIINTQQVGRQIDLRIKKFGKTSNSRTFIRRST